MKAKLKPEWFNEQWVLIADRNPTRALDVKKALIEIGFPESRMKALSRTDEITNFVDEKRVAIAVFDDSMGTPLFREVHARLVDAFGAMGFFLFTITEGKTDDFTQFAAAARIDGLIFRPYDLEEFRNRVAETFAVKWPNRYVPGIDAADLFGGSSDEIFKRALEKERRLGHRGVLTQDPKVAGSIGMRKIEIEGIKEGKASFEKVRLSFRAIARNGEALGQPVPIHAIEVDEYEATFECAANEGWTVGDHVSIEAEIVHGPEKYHLRIEAKVRGDAGMGLISVEFDEGNRVRFESAMRMVTKRFKELKEFFKYAKGA